MKSDSSLGRPGYEAMHTLLFRCALTGIGAVANWNISIVYYDCMRGSGQKLIY